ncbi:1-deoxy-D-xylulose-5-phosphate reductoisomerase [Chelatococcus sp. SYSU_G07232]|uniref:1-deoxy-D-xylulose 5-phosphate reductoisomerase n=1 Tax=Chelatococcus albus TaxID=3047466 RepID=A0ABT7AD86_9HYPH|nr:1-deoxy-D-xylulose-5-phosphate reductoisomerase [Chelatococcus sp. SYSU_G07232]MDJ1156774.1 1-deoxy-D-xylulose-5-phosphate reductoisomerase [Chelatococcus sp. SYSU_G07232]
MITRITILGATGSVGRSTADLLAEHRDRFRVSAVVGGSDAVALADVARRLDAEFAAVADERAGRALSEALAGTGIACGAGRSAVCDAVDRETDVVVAAIVGTAGLEPTHGAIRPGRSIALANKESLVCAGAAFMRDARAAGVPVLPLDSEHNALLQALGTAATSDVERMILTASGGPFRTWTIEEIARATPEQALAHPTWSMGAKITIDSASLMNKGLELIEAHHLFGIEAERLDVLVHPQSIVHGLVAFRDGAVSAGLAIPDMRVPIAHCLGTGQRLTTTARRLDLAAIGTLTFEAPDLARFPALKAARQALAAGGAMPTVLNAANEIAVEAFLARRLGFAQIAALVEETCARFAGRGTGAPASVHDALAIDHEARRTATEILSSGRRAAS